MYDWLSYWNGTECGLTSNEQVIDRDFFPKREWSFTIEDDIYIRYQSFRDKNEFIAAIQKRQPHKIDIGAVFSASPKDHASIKPEKFKPVERELVFDIDMTDYDDIRKCCTGANICKKCWPYMTMAIKVIDQSLREDFAFQNILWVYSGRRGVHCWVCDPLARALTNEQRTAIVEYLSVETGSSDNSDKKVKNTFLNNSNATGGSAVHPMIKRAYDTLEPLFEKFIISEDGQGLLSTNESFANVLKTLPVESVRHDLYEEIKDDKRISSTTDNNKKAILRWKLIKQATSAAAFTNNSNINNGNKKKKFINYYELEAWRMELVFTHCYPRLDANVSKAQNHLLKSPFCIHPKTGRVCVPIDPREADSFDPFTVPTLRVLCEEVCWLSNILNFLSTVLFTIMHEL